MTPPAIEPTPWIVAKTPKKEGGFPSAAMTEKISVSEKPTTSRATAMPPTRPGATAASPRRGASPAVTSRAKWCSGRRGLLLVHAHAREEEDRRREGGGVEDRDGAAAEHGVQPGTRERRDDPQALAARP